MLTPTYARTYVRTFAFAHKATRACAQTICQCTYVHTYLCAQSPSRGSPHPNACSNTGAHFPLPRNGCTYVRARKHPLPREWLCVQESIRHPANGCACKKNALSTNEWLYMQETHSLRARTQITRSSRTRHRTPSGRAEPNPSPTSGRRAGQNSQASPRAPMTRPKGRGANAHPERS